jgi:membrane fusion protein (multidrug efflux system)
MKFNWAMLAFVLGALSACSDEAKTSKGPGKAADTPVEVGVMTLKSETLPRTVELPGRVLANATAEIRPQVDGIIEKRLFQEGGPIKVGDALYVLNDDKFKATVAAAKAVLQRSEATVSGAQLTYDRTRQLMQTKAASQQDLDAAHTALLQAQADEAAAKAALESAQINLDDATIKAPISGIISTSSVSAGALVTENQTDALATIRQIDPALVDLVDTSVNLLRIRDEVRTGTLGGFGQGGPPKVTLILENGDTYNKQGEMSLANIVVSETTGTFTLRAVFPNPDRLLLPGMFVRARINLGVTPNTFKVPQRAVMRDAAGQATAFVVSAGNRIETRILTATGTLGPDWLVTKGIKNGDKLVVDGFQQIRDGARVKPHEVTIDGDGVVKEPEEAANLAKDAKPKAEVEK